MKVFKFGGAAVKDATGIINTAAIIDAEQDQLIVVVSAMGKTTDALVEITRLYFDGKVEEALQAIDKLKLYHLEIVNSLFESANEKLMHSLSLEFDALSKRVNIMPSLNYDFEYDQIVSTGEMVSTEILAAYLNHICLLYTSPSPRDVHLSIRRQRQMCIRDRVNIMPSLNYDFEYDQIVSTGEMVSTEILAAYLNHICLLYTSPSPRDGLLA